MTRGASAGCTRRCRGAVDDVAAGDHLGGGEIVEGLPLGGVCGVNAAVDPDAEEDLGLHGLDGAADVRTGVLPPGDGFRLIGAQDIEARGGRVPVGRNVPQDESAAGVGVGVRVVECDVEAGAGPGQGERDAVGRQGAFGVRECGDQGQRVAGGAGPSAGRDFPLTGKLEEFVRTGEQVCRVEVQAAGEVGHPPSTATCSPSRCGAASRAS
ncbi:hypothetical protein [Streptomyces sp. NPDC048473]|uniref:hypothetical protein n=1 Tax=unclassified Streptomyces TaxID=2593676 RepID=UPI00370FE9D3